MNKTLISVIVFVLCLTAIGVVVAESLGSEVTSLTFYNAYYNTYAGNTCMSGFGVNVACFDNDGGYTPTVQGNFAGLVALMTPTVSGNTTYFHTTAPFPINYQCVAAAEYCEVSTGYLIEAICGSSMGIGSSQAFNAEFPGNYWTVTGEPAAIARVNCATYAANHPGLGLQGICHSGACI